ALVEQMGGPSTPGTGWAAGIERLMMLCTNPPPARRPIAVIPHGDDEVSVALTLSRRLRRAGFMVEFNSFERFAKRMKWANRIYARACLILGSDECARGVVALRDMDSGEQQEVALDDLEDRLAHLN
ncbi:MAG: histidine--tRNA ligase, partial [Hyphomicrobiales bacterium]|nr:histidine--tRNA ligase [Hyphomicrobiales bacterium]